VQGTGCPAAVRAFTDLKAPVLHCHRPESTSQSGNDTSHQALYVAQCKGKLLMLKGTI
jgi:hypothetical protein